MSHILRESPCFCQLTQPTPLSYVLTVTNCLPPPYYIAFLSSSHTSCVCSLQSCLTLCDPMDHSLLGSSVHGILQARILEWVAICSSRGSSQNCVYCLLHWQAGSLPLVPSGKPWLLECKPHEAATMSVLFMCAQPIAQSLE